MFSLQTNPWILLINVKKYINVYNKWIHIYYITLHYIITMWILFSRSLVRLWPFRLLPKDWLIIGFKRTIIQYRLVEKIYLGEGGCRPSPPDSRYGLVIGRLRPLNSPWIRFHNPASINQSGLVDLVSDWLMPAASTSKTSVNQSKWTQSAPFKYFAPNSS